MPIWYGGDYNPEQWPESVWDEDVRLMREGGINLVTLGVFAWARLEPREGEFDFAWLDRVIDKLHAGGISVDLATATATPPPWLTHRYPEVLPVTADGVRLSPGSRQHYCPSSPVYRRLASRLVRAIAERYRDHPALRLWHVNNEYACHVSHCYCDVSADAFRAWLERKYGSVDGLNQAWGTTFWGQIYTEFEEVYPPSAAPTFVNPTQLLDFDRFSSDELLDCFRMERDILREVTPQIAVTTNFLGFSKRADYWSWAPEVDVVSYDSYPDPDEAESPARAAMSHDLMRSLRSGQSWLLMEQSPGAVSWLPQNRPKHPGQQRSWSYQAIARGADGALFFQWRQAAAGAERFMTGMVPHSGTGGRVWRETREVGAELQSLEAVEGTRIESRVAIVFDWDSWWSIEQSALPAQLSYWDGLFAWYQELYSRNVVVDFAAPTSDLTRYDLVLVPSLFVLAEDGARNLDEFARSGGTLAVTYQSGITDENGHLSAGGFLGGLSATLGVRVEEFAPLRPGVSLPMEGDVLGGSGALVWSETVHATDAEVLAVFGADHVAGSPALTRNATGAGTAWYVATLPDEKGRAALLDRLLAEAGIDEEWQGAEAGTEIVRRGERVFVLNHRAQDVVAQVPGHDLITGQDEAERVLPPQGVAIIEQVRVEA